MSQRRHGACRQATVQETAAQRTYPNRTSRLAKKYPATNEFKAGIVASYHPSGSLERTQFLRLQAVALTLTGTVLVVVCMNISGMMQVRSAMRERELSIRQATGASRGRLVQHLLSEAIILAGLGGALGSVVLFNIPPVLSWWVGRPFPVPVQPRGYRLRRTRTLRRRSPSST
jgi:ABC-type antimicrobial peptide transport system permease subunit